MVRGISQFSECEIWESFEKIAVVKDVRRVKDRFTGEFKDFAFVEFENEYEADLVIEISVVSCIRVNGKPVFVCKSKNKKVENSEAEEKKSEKIGFENSLSRCETEKNQVIEVAKKNIEENVKKRNCKGQADLTRKSELENLWQERLKTGIAICFHCQKWFASVEIGKLHDICEG